MLQNWLKPIKGHNGPVLALNVIPEPGRNRVNLIGIAAGAAAKILPIRSPFARGLRTQFGIP